MKLSLSLDHVQEVANKRYTNYFIRILCSCFCCQRQSPFNGENQILILYYNKWCTLVLQDWILSPKQLFVYMDDISKKLIHSDVGCYIYKVYADFMFYVDDVWRMAPCTIALQQLIDICRRYRLIAILRTMLDTNFYAIRS